MCSALTVIFLFAAGYLPISIALLFASSIVMGVCILKYKTTAAIITFLASSFLGLFLLNDKLIALLYIVIFGVYPILKLIIEKLRLIVAEYAIKFLIWNIQLVCIYIIFSALGQEDLMSLANFWFWLAGIIVLCAYDLIFGMFMNGFYKTYGRFFK